MDYYVDFYKNLDCGRVVAMCLIVEKNGFGWLLWYFGGYFNKKL